MAILNDNLAVKLIKKIEANMCYCEEENKEVICKGIDELITVKWDEYSETLRIKSGEYGGLALKEKEAIDVAKTILRVIERAKIDEIQKQCSHK